MSPVLGSGPRGRDTTRARILQAAMELFGQRGFDGTTVKNIADRCGLTDAAVYYYFRSKREILDALWQTPRIQELTVARPGGPVAIGLVGSLVDDILDAAAEQDALLRLLVRQVLAEDRTAVALRNQAMAQWRLALFNRIRPATQSDHEARRMVEALVLLAQGVILHGQMTFGPRFAEAVRDPALRARVKRMAALVLRVPPEEEPGPAACGR